jgi:hypothetical protein|nr:hypothetical protein [Neorhizobium tomejilense]
MRPFESYASQGAEAWLSGKNEAANPYGENSLARIEWLKGHLSAIVESGDLNESDLDCAKLYLDETEFATKRKTSRLRLDLPTATAVSDAIGIPVSKWRGNCFAISVAALESGVLDDFQEKHGVLVPAYGMYDGPLAEGKRRFNRHGWLESTAGHVVDPTRWVFTEDYPHLWAGSIDDYDLGGMRLRAAHRPYKAPLPEGEQIRLGINDPNQLAAFDRLLGDRTVSQSGMISVNRFHWVLTSPLETLGYDADMFVKVADRLGRGGLVPVDTRLWVDFTSNGYHPQKLREKYSGLPETTETKPQLQPAFSPF